MSEWARQRAERLQRALETRVDFLDEANAVGEFFIPALDEAVARGKSAERARIIGMLREPSEEMVEAIADHIESCEFILRKWADEAALDIAQTIAAKLEESDG